jgi:hypothetical protein
LNINVPVYAREHFWVEPEEGSVEFWAFRFQPKCNPGDKINFMMDGKVVAEAEVAWIELPGKSSCDSTGRFKSRWKVFWYPDSFKDRRGT